jgi:hypothetical protein
MLPLLSMLQIVNKFSEVETYFRKLSFWSNKFVKQLLLTQKFKKVTKIFCCGGCKNLGGSWNGGGGGGGAQEVKIDLMHTGVPKVSNFSLFLIFQVASCGRPKSLPSSVSFYLRWKKRTLQLHFCKEIALNNMILRKQARITNFFKILEVKTTLQWLFTWLEGFFLPSLQG